MENESEINQIEDSVLEGVSGGYKSVPRVSNDNKYIFKVMCAKCGHQELMVLEKQDVKTWICINCKMWNVSKMKKESSGYCYTYTAEEYNKLLKGGSTL